MLANIAITVGIFVALGLGIFSVTASKETREDFFGQIGVAAVQFIMLGIFVGLFYGVYKLVESSR